MRYARERLTPGLLHEALPLLRAHKDEIAHYQDIPLDVAEEKYLAMDLAGTLRVFTARVDDATASLDNKLVGYAVFFVAPNLHYRGSLQASQDILYMDPAHRGRGLVFINWCDEQLRQEGVQAVYQHLKVEHDFGRALERLGYVFVDKIYARRLDR